MDRAGGGGPGRPGRLGRRRVRQVQPRVDQGDRHPVDEGRLAVGSGTSRPPAVGSGISRPPAFAPASFPERGFAPRRPRTSQLLDFSPVPGLPGALAAVSCDTAGARASANLALAHLPGHPGSDELGALATGLASPDEVVRVTAAIALPADRRRHCPTRH
ncbi:hypothetical protein ACH4OX_07720 [Streptomyces roseolus]|uniref:hypothetical protein n=1 Tax=Streptomyces roseolus TaxID=67358 RepID=UPI0037BC79CA